MGFTNVATCKSVGSAILEPCGEVRSVDKSTRVQAAVTAKAEELERDQAMIDHERPDPGRRLTFEQSMSLIKARYSRAIDLLGKL